MGDYIFKIKGLTAQDRAQWEKDNLKILKGENYFNKTDEDKDRYFRNVSFRHKFGNRQDYDKLTQLSPTQRDSLFAASDDNVDKEITFSTTKNAYKNDYNKYLNKDGNLIGRDRQEWENIDSFLTKNSELYGRYKGSEYLPLETQNKVDLMADYNTLVKVYGEEEGKNQFIQKVNNTISENQPKLDTLWRGFTGMGAQAAGGIISFAGFIKSIPTTLAAITGVDRIFGENQRKGYLDNIGAARTSDPWLAYGDAVSKQGTFFTSDDPKKEHNRLEILKTADEEKSMWKYFTNSPLKFTMELLQNNGFTVASMFIGGALSKLGNTLFNTAKEVSIAGKIGKTVEEASKVNASLERLAKLNQGFSASIPAIMGTHEGVLNGFNTKQAFLENAEQVIDKNQEKAFNEEYKRRVQEYLKKAPLKRTKEGTYSNDFRKAEQKIKLDLLHEFANKRKEDLDKAEEDGNKAALVNTALNSFINGIGNTLLKAPMFGGQVEKALNRTFVGKLFAKDKFKMKGDKAVAKELTKKEIAGKMIKEAAGEGMEEYLQDVTDAFATGGAEYDLTAYLQKKYNPDVKDALADGFMENLGAAFAAAGEAAISKDAIRSGVYGALGQMLGTPNVHAIVSPQQTFRNFKNKSFLEKVNTIWRNPLIESYYNAKQENINRRESAKAINDWLNEGNNREKLTSIRGALGWAKGMEDAAQKGDEFDFRNSRVGKLVADAFMLEHIKDTPLYNTYVERYMSIINAKEGDEVANEIAKYDDRPLELIQKDAQRMLTTMQKVQEATADIEKSLGNSIPQQTKESLVFGKVMMEDWDTRSSELEKDLSNNVNLPEVTSALTKEQKEYIANNGSPKTPTTYNTEISELEKQINNLEKNEKILTKKQKEELSDKKKSLKRLQKAQEKETSEYNKMFSEEFESPEVLTQADIMSLSPEDRYKMLNPENRSKFSKEQQEIIEDLINEGTKSTSDFMNKVEDAARIVEAQRRFLNQYNAALRNPNILVDIENSLRFEKAYDDSKKEIEKLKEASNYSDFANRFETLTRENPLALMSAEESLKDNAFYTRYKDERTIVGTLNTRMLEDNKFKDVSQADKDLAGALIHYLVRNDVNIEDPSAIDAAFNEVDDQGLSAVTKFVNTLNEVLPENQKISLDNVKNVAALVKSTITSFNNNEETKKLIDTTPREDIQEGKPQRSIFDSPSATRELPTKADETFKKEEEKQEEEKQEEQKDTKESSEPNYFGMLDTTVDNVLNESLKNISDTTIEAIKQAIEEEINKLKESANANKWTLEDFINELNSLASKYTLKSLPDNSSIAKDIFAKIGLALRTPNRSVYTSNTIPLELFLNSDKAIGRFLEESGAYQYLTNGESKFNKPIVFITSLELTDSVRKEMGNSRYTSDALPIIVAVKGEGTLSIDGQLYQPIGVLPSSTRNGNTRIIRDLAVHQLDTNNIQSYHIVTDVSGAGHLTTSINALTGQIGNASSKKESQESQERRKTNILDTIKNSLTAKEKAKLGEHPEGSKEYLETLRSIFNDYINTIARRIITINTDYGPKFAYVYQKLKKDGSTGTPVTLFNKTLENWRDIWGRSVRDFIKNKNPEALFRANANIANFVQALKNYYDEFSKNPNSLEEINKKIHETLKQQLYSSIGKYSLSTIEINTGETRLGLYLGKELLGYIDGDNNDMFDLLSKLFLPNGVEERYRNGLTLNVNTHDGSIDTIKRYLIDNLLQFNIENINDSPISVVINTPRDPNAPRSHTLVINSNSATSSVTPVKTNNGEIVDPDTGLTEDGNTVSKNVPIEVPSKQEVTKQKDTKKEEQEGNKEQKEDTKPKVGESNAASILEDLGPIIIEGEAAQQGTKSKNSRPRPNLYDCSSKELEASVGTEEQVKDMATIEKSTIEHQKEQGCI